LTIAIDMTRALELSDTIPFTPSHSMTMQQSGNPTVYPMLRHYEVRNGSRNDSMVDILKDAYRHHSNVQAGLFIRNEYLYSIMSS
jgi:hypothetical protein